MDICPCIECDKQGCGPYHDICPDYQKFAKKKQAESKAYRDRYEFTRSKRKLHKCSTVYKDKYKM